MSNKFKKNVEWASEFFRVPTKIIIIKPLLYVALSKTGELNEKKCSEMQKRSSNTAL